MVPVQTAAFALVSGFKPSANWPNQGPGTRRVSNRLTNIRRATKVFGTKLRGRGHDALVTDLPTFVELLKFSVQNSGGRGHDGLVNCVRTGMSKSVSISKTFVAANAIYSHKFAGHEALVSTFVATYEYPPVTFSVVGISRNQ